MIENNEMKVLLRPGPYICGEIDNGGIPSWLNDHNIRRIWDPTFRNGVDSYLTAIAE